MTIVQLCNKNTKYIINVFGSICVDKIVINYETMNSVLCPSGTYCNSASACFVASDGKNLRLYQAVVDARKLLDELSDPETSVSEHTRTALHTQKNKCYRSFGGDSLCLESLFSECYVSVSSCLTLFTLKLLSQRTRFPVQTRLVSRHMGGWQV